jgi:hypothetical protein
MTSPLIWRIALPSATNDRPVSVHQIAVGCTNARTRANPSFNPCAVAGQRRDTSIRLDYTNAAIASVCNEKLILPGRDAARCVEFSVASGTIGKAYRAPGDSRYFAVLDNANSIVIGIGNKDLTLSHSNADRSVEQRAAASPSAKPDVPSTPATRVILPAASTDLIVFVPEIGDDQIAGRIKGHA